MSVVRRRWFIAPPGKRDRFDFLSLCYICGAVVLDASEDGQSTWRRHMNWHSIEEQKAVAEELHRDAIEAQRQVTE